MTIRAAVIGVGQMGGHHARTYASLPGVELVAVADTDFKRATEIADKFGCVAFSSYNEMLQKIKPDAVSIAVPTSAHKEVAIAALKARAAVLVEKPIASDAKEAAEIIKAAKSARLPLMVGHVERFNSAVQELSRIIRAKRLGKITSIIARRVGLFPPRIKDMNVVVDLASHDIDVCSMLLNRKPSEVFATAGRALISKREDYADIFLKYDGTNAMVQVNWITPVKIRRLSVTGTKGHAELDYITQELKLYESVYKRFTDPLTFEQLVKFTSPKIKRTKIKRVEPLKEELAAFIKSARTGRLDRSAATGEDGLLTLQIALKVLESYRKSRVVRV